MNSFNLPDFVGKDVVFIGKGKEWTSFQNFYNTFLQQSSSLRNVFITDANREATNAELRTLSQETTIIVKTAGYPGGLMPVPYTTPTRIFFDCARQLGSTIVGITGTKGKTTTSMLLGAMLKNAGLNTVLCGNMGTPMLDTLFEAASKTVFVVELSSYQLTELQQSPDVAVVTNLYRDHLDYHGTIDAYWEAKHNIMRFMNENNTVVYNPSTKIIGHWLAETKVQAKAIDPDEVVDMSKAKLIGDHNRLNYLLARKVAELFGVDKITIQNTLNSFEPVRHRLQIVRTARGITYVDDAIGSNPEATIAGIEALVRNKGPVGCVMLGGVDRQYDYSELVKLLSVLQIPKLVLFPDTGMLIKAALPPNYTPDTFETSSMDEAVSWASEHTPSGSICLLSTAAPSTVLWSSFEEKGSLFQQAVLNLPA